MLFYTTVPVNTEKGGNTSSSLSGVYSEKSQVNNGALYPRSEDLPISSILSLSISNILR